MALRTLNDPITLLTLERLDEEIRSCGTSTKIELESLRNRIVLECQVFEQQIKEMANG